MPETRVVIHQVKRGMLVPFEQSALLLDLDGDEERKLQGEPKYAEITVVSVLVLHGPFCQRDGASVE